MESDGGPGVDHGGEAGADGPEDAPVDVASRGASNHEPHTLETIEPPGRADVRDHFLRSLSRMIVRARLENRLRTLVAEKDASRATLDRFHRDFAAAYRALFQHSLLVVNDPTASGDQIIDICARSIPPGVEATVLGTQNIKGTGLDFVYRWIAIDHVVGLLDQVNSDSSERRIGALSSLNGFEDYGLFGAGLARAVLNETTTRPLSDQEASLRSQLLHKVNAIHRDLQSSLGGSSARTTANRLAGWIESWIDYLDSIRRRRKSKRIMKDLMDRRISTARAALEMRAIVSRQKGNWLAKSLRRKRR